VNGNPDFVFWLDVTIFKAVRLAIVQAVISFIGECVEVIDFCLTFDN
jgi:hypothetical protein